MKAIIISSLLLAFNSVFVVAVPLSDKDTCALSCITQCGGGQASFTCDGPRVTSCTCG
ncbi:uncharacterized protein LY79DRAFT_572600 [Colletotrichum navitas]|uniref:Uncharacterized protein n=1 Tax=Colletotrichum navitas TaxID=681940 RepID=A0AAD8UYL9_9PEZI|nr:uncharacterized protein LY79DRAFT_572600 [Colletotrichum navitas]KAK1566180.1 hypothetical protein LY79DRAFT_572600 [Colletotrichum navitas]